MLAQKKPHCIHTSDRDTIGDVVQRDIVPDDDDEDEELIGPLLWVPYVHFGV